MQFRGDLWRPKTRVPGLSCDVVSVILRLAVLVGLRLVTDGQTDRQTDGHRAMASTAAAEHRAVIKHAIAAQLWCCVTCDLDMSASTQLQLLAPCMSSRHPSALPPFPLKCQHVRLVHPVPLTARVTLPSSLILRNISSQRAL